MGIFSFAKKEETLSVVFDVRSSSVGAALFTQDQDKVSKIIYTAREPIHAEEALEADKFFEATIAALDVVANKVFKVGVGAPKAAYCVLASPWYVAQARVISLKENSPFVFTNKLADDLIQKEILLFEEEHLKAYLGSKHKIRPIELKNIRTMLNGYETSTPLNQKATELEMTMYLSMSPDQILSRIENTINKYFHMPTVKFSSFLMAAFTTIRDAFAEEENFLLIDIGGEMTDISMTRKNILHESISFPMGHNFMIRGVATALNCALGEAESFLSIYKEGHAEATMEEKLKPIIENLKTEWLGNFQESLAKLSKDVYIPSTIYLCIDPEFASFFSKIIETEQFNQYTLTKSKFNIIVLNTETLHNTVVFEKNAARDPFLAISAVYINRFLINQN